MNKETQDLAWKSIPRETRDEIRTVFNMPSKYGYPDSARKLLIDIYGDNLTSNEELPELLYVERKKVIEYFTEINEAIDITTDPFVVLQSIGMQTALNSLFGNKCMPDK